MKKHPLLLLSFLCLFAFSGMANEATSCDPVEILNNQSFETGAAFNQPFNTDWFPFGAVFAIDGSIIPPVQDGQFYLKMFGGNSGIFQDHPAIPGESLTASVYVMNASFDPMLPGCTGFIKLEYFDAGNGLVSVTESTKLDHTLPSNTWTQITLNDVVPAGAATVRMVVIMQCTAGGAVMFDNASLVGCDLPDPGATVEFCVDVSCYSDVQSVNVFGSFNGWCGGCTPLTPSDNGYYCTELFLAPGDYEYKFLINGIEEHFPPFQDECTITPFWPFTNRPLNVMNGVDQELLHGFNSCEEYCGGGEIELCLDTNCADFEPGYISVFGTFNIWNPGATQMFDDDEDGIYCRTILLSNGVHEFKFFNGVEEIFTPGDECTLTTGQFTNRIVVVDNGDQSLTYAWESCEECDICPFEDVRPTVDCPSNFEVYTEQFYCEAYVSIPAPTVEDECPTAVEARVRKVDPETLNNIPGEGWSPWSADPSGYYEVGTYRVRWRATDQAGNRRACNFYFTVKEELPCPWIQLPNGVGCQEGNSASYDDGVFTLHSTDCYNPTTTNSDEFAFVQQTICGDGSITAQVTSLTGNAAGWAGVSMREVGYYQEYGYNDDGGKSVTLLTNLSNRHRTEIRLATDGPVTASQSNSFYRHWLRIVRSGPNFTGYTSSNGVTWFLKFSIQVDMDACIDVGLVLNSQWSTGDQTATFAHVEVEGGGGAPNPTIQAITGGQENAQLGDRGNRLAVTNAAQQAPRSFTVYPNPSIGSTTISLGEYEEDNVQLDVLNVYGQVVQQLLSGVVEDNTMDVDLSGQPAGVYFIRLRLADGEERLQRLILQARP